MSSGKRNLAHIGHLIPRKKKKRKFQITNVRKIIGKA